MSSLFLDANILLDFYRFGDDDISEIGKIVELVQGKEITLYANSQLKKEVERNREKVISESFASLKATKFGLRSPNYCEGFPELTELRKALKTSGERHSELVRAIEEKIGIRELAADKLIASLFSISTELHVDNTIVEKARLRLGCVDV